VPGRRRRERALLVHVHLPGRYDPEDLEELRRLAESAGAEVVGAVTGRRDAPDAATFVGRGKAEEVGARAKETGAELVLVNHELSPSQERNLEKIVACRVLDRVGLILDIFAQRAQSAEGKLQVELAQLEHLATRLVRGWTHLERQKGGIGLRGPGETQLETDRRLIRDRIKKLNERLERVAVQRRSRRRARHKVPIPTVSLVGYTNAGKSSLFNRLTGSAVYSADQLFATLDPTMRRLELPGKVSIVLADTVGFVRHLPHDLVEAFKSTLEEVAAADLLLHVVDQSSPERSEQQQRVNEVLAEIGAADIPQLMIFNKIDLSGDPPGSAPGEADQPGRLWLSAHTGAGVEHLREALSAFFRRDRRVVRFRLPPEASRLRAILYERFEVQNEIPAEDGSAEIRVALNGAQLDWFSQQDGYDPGYRIDDQAVVLAPTGS
jgi:GTP-binding protein HflX